MSCSSLAILIGSMLHCHKMAIAGGAFESFREAVTSQSRCQTGIWQIQEPFSAYFKGKVMA